jgi:hypothetical protein
MSGEAGIGKSRLTAALLEQFATEPHTRLRYFCSPQHTDSALHPIIGQMERAAGLAHGDTAQSKLDKLDALLARTSISKQDAALFAEMLSLPNDGRYAALESDPQRQRQRQLEALNLQMEVLSRSHPLLMIVEDVHWSDPTSLELFDRTVALDRLIVAASLFRQGVRPHASYLFKHALIQDAAYGTLLPEPRRALHARIAETLDDQLAEIAENQPELLARHCTEAGLIEKAVGLWYKAGQRSQQRSALVEAVEQFKRPLDQIATLPSTPALRRMRIDLQVALISPLVHVKGYGAPETKAAVERARLLLEEVDALRETPKDPCYSPFCMVSSSQTSKPSTVIYVSTSPLSFWHLLRNKKPRFRWCSGMISWALPYCSEETSRKVERISIKGSHFMILPNIVPWRYALARPHW